MKKTILFIFAVIAVVCSSCDDGDSEYENYKYVSMSGQWTLHLTGTWYQDSTVKNPNRNVQMVWTDMTYIDSLVQTRISSQVTIGNGVWRFYSYVAGRTAGTYYLCDSSYATYTYFTNPMYDDSCTTIKYKLTGMAVWEANITNGVADTKEATVTFDIAATNDAGETVKVKGPVPAALEVTAFEDPTTDANSTGGNTTGGSDGDDDDDDVIDIDLSNLTPEQIAELMKELQQ